MIQIKLSHKDAKIPSKGSELAAGFDLYATEVGELAFGERMLVGTGVHIAGNEDEIYWRVAPRSGLAVKHGIDVLAGVVDADYRGEIKVCLINLGKEPFKFAVGDRIAQLVPTAYKPYRVARFQLVDELGESTRGTGSFGSTGK